MYRVGIIGAGRLGSLVAQALKDGKAPACELVAMLDQNEEVVKEKAEAFQCVGVTTIEKFTSLKLDYVIEASRIPAIKEYLPYLLKAKITPILLSSGVFENDAYREEIKQLAEKNKTHVYLATGCLAGFDLAETVRVMGNGKATVVQYLPPKEVRPDTPMKDFPEEFHGSVREGFAISPAHLNTVIAGGLACGSLDENDFEIRTAKPGYGSFGLEMKNDQLEGTIIISNLSFEMIAMSTVAKLNRLTDWITF